MIDNFYENGILVTREITIEERCAQLAKANAIHIDDVYEAVALLKRLRVFYQPGLGEGMWADIEAFLDKMGGPPRG